MMNNTKKSALEARERMLRRGTVCAAENAFEGELSACIAAYDGDMQKQYAVLTKTKDDLLKTADSLETRNMIDESLSEALLVVEATLRELSLEKEQDEALTNGNIRIAALMKDADYSGNPKEFYDIHRKAFMEIISDLYFKEEAELEIGLLMAELTENKLTELALTGELQALVAIGGEALKRGYIAEGDYVRRLCQAERTMAQYETARSVAEYTERLSDKAHASYDILKELTNSELSEAQFLLAGVNLKEAIKNSQSVNAIEKKAEADYSKLLSAGAVDELVQRVQNDLALGMVSQRFARSWQNRYEAVTKAHEYEAFALSPFGLALQRAVLSAVQKAVLISENAANSSYSVDIGADGEGLKAVVHFNDHSARTEDGRLIPIPQAFWGTMLTCMDMRRTKDYMQICLGTFAEDKEKKQLLGEYTARLSELAVIAGIASDNPRMLYLAAYFEDGLREYKQTDNADRRMAVWQNAEREALENYLRRFRRADAGILSTEYNQDALGLSFEELNDFSINVQGLELSAVSLKAASGGVFYSAAMSYLVPPDFLSALDYLNSKYLKAGMEGLSQMIINIPISAAWDYPGHLGTAEDDAHYVAFMVRWLIEEGRSSSKLVNAASLEDFRYAATEIGLRCYGLDADTAKEYADEAMDYYDKHRLLALASLSPEQIIVINKELNQ